MPHGEVLKSLEDGDEYKYLGVLEADNIKHETMKNKPALQWFVEYDLT